MEWISVYIYTFIAITFAIAIDIRKDAKMAKTYNPFTIALGSLLWPLIVAVLLWLKFIDWIRGE